MGIGGWIALGVLAAAVIFAVAVYNRLVALRNRFKNAFAQIDVQLKRRYDLIPNLVETAKGYMQHERGTLEAVIAARGAAVSAERPRGRGAGRPGGDARPGAGRRRARRRARAAVRGVRGLPGPQGQPEHDAACRRSSPAPRTRSPSRARPTTTR